MVQTAEPTVRNLNVRGLQVGGTTTISLDGDDLGKAPRLLLPFPAKESLKPGATDKKAEFEVTLGDDVAPGLYHLRVVTDGGASLPVIVGVDRLPQAPLGPRIARLPAAVHGAVAGSTIVETTFTGKAGEKVTVEVEAQRLGSKLRPVVHLYTAKKLQVAWAWGTPALAGDARLEATLPADGAYAIAVHDAEYAGPSPGHFRLKVGRFGFVDQVFPPVVGADAKAVELLGSAPARIALPKLNGRATLLDWPEGRDWTGPRPWVEVSSRPELVEPGEPGRVFELPPGSAGISGRLAAPYEEDRFRVPVMPNTRVRFEVFAERIGSPVDAAFVVRNDASGELARAEDSPGSLDPVLEYAVPDKVTSVVVGVLDAAGRGGPRAVYRLAVDPVSDGGPGDFRLSTPVQRLALASGGRAVVPVFVERRGYAGRIDLLADGLPGGIRVEGATISPDATGALVTVTANSLPSAAVGTLSGRATDGATHDVVVRGHPLERLQPWLASEFVVAPTSRKADEFAVDWRNLPADAALKPAGKLALPVTVRRADAAAPVRLTLLTSQAPPVGNNNQPDPNRAIRVERPTEFAAKVGDGELPVVVPAELPADSYQLAVQAELLSPDKQKVLATAFTPVRSFPVRLPVAVKLDVAKLAATLDAKAPTAVEVRGSVERLHGFAGDVVVSLAGLPAGVAAPAPVTLKAVLRKMAVRLPVPFSRAAATIRIADETRFAFKLAFPPGTAPGDVKLKLSASVVADPKQPNVRVKGRDAEAVLTVLAAPK